MESGRSGNSAGEIKSNEGKVITIMTDKALLSYDSKIIQP
jgi:hypothetical protein